MVVLLPLVGCQWQESRYAWFRGAEYWKLIGIFSNRQFQHELAARMEIQKLRCHLIEIVVKMSNFSNRRICREDFSLCSSSSGHWIHVDNLKCLIEIVAPKLKSLNVIM
ncbi:hypothetical protein PVK06_031750 [Gossypium arboreum]|uniref:Uncharacterized protein n=1 Tax=Gossypium arboreum TaxID=29729 RepID=A0ABR0NSZ4_GOSAR|nr:hypothetical protein PVK06_031750 [Gossypium arboreum]